MKNIFRILLFLLLSGAAGTSAEVAPRYAVALIPTPVLNRPDFPGIFGGRDGRTILTDSCGQIRALEFIALPGTRFRIEETVTRGATPVYRVTTDDYPYPTRTGYFIDSRFVTTMSDQPPSRPRILPPLASIRDDLLAAQGSPYVWGGNLRRGIPEMSALFPIASGSRLSPATSGLWQLRGVDCSGLLYEATGGFTPRNTSALVEFGQPVPIAGKSSEKIICVLKPLDLIVWQGHVVIVLDRERVIESRLDCSGGNAGGVRVRPLGAALADIMKRRKPVDAIENADPSGSGGFVARRWYNVKSSAEASDRRNPDQGQK